MSAALGGPQRPTAAEGSWAAGDAGCSPRVSAASALNCIQVAPSEGSDD